VAVALRHRCRAEAVQEFVPMAHGPPLRRSRPTCTSDVVIELLEPQKGGLTWMLGGFLSCFSSRSRLKAVLEERAPATRPWVRR